RKNPPARCPRRRRSPVPKSALAGIALGGGGLRLPRAPTWPPSVVVRRQTVGCALGIRRAPKRPRHSITDPWEHDTADAGLGAPVERLTVQQFKSLSCTQSAPARLWA